MEMTAGLFQAIFAGVTLLILWSSTLAGGVVWILNSITKAKKEILEDFNAKHKANDENVKALQILVMRHDLLLNQEFGSPISNGRSKHLRG